MTSDTAWIAEARRLYETGTPITAIFRMLGQTDYAVRMALDIEGYREKKRAQTAAQKARYKLAREAGAAPRSKPRDRSKPIDAVVLGRYVPRPVTLPKLAFLAKPMDEAPAAFRLAPTTYCRVEPARIAAIREIHRRMIRAGKFEASEPEVRA